MSALITHVEILNFRSIRCLLLPLNYLSVLVGANDSGKSNVLRALNLFFNGETNPGQRFNFAADHNIYNNPRQRAKEIVIRLRIELPEAYKATNGDEIVWEKRWRETGLFHDGYHGVRVSTNRVGRETREDVTLPSRSNVHSLLRKMEFVYVPAIRDATYFDLLRGQIHAVISEVADTTFRASSADFERSIAEHLGGLTADIQTELGFASRLALPKDLSHIFERLDFLTGDTEISLDARGDGIKARHIPLILKFMADQKRRLQTRGAAPISIVWGYEEPENNLEFTNAVGLADELWNFMAADVAQVVVTSHSPVFYNLQEKNSNDSSYVSCLHVYRDSSDRGTEITEKLDDLDDRLGTTAVLAPKILALEARVREQEQAKVRAEQLAAAGRSKIFVEGTSDQIFVSKLFAVFAPGFVGAEVDIETLASGAGHSYVGDMLRAWYCVQKHNEGRPRAVGLVDNDSPGNFLRREWNAVHEQAAIAKCFVWPVPPRAVAARQQGFNVPVTLEELYPEAEWNMAHVADGLEGRNVQELMSNDRLNAIVTGEAQIGDFLTEGIQNLVLRKYSQAAKRPAAIRMSNLSAADFERDFGFLRPLVQEVIAYLRP